MAHSFKNLKIVRESVIETFFPKVYVYVKFTSSPAKNDRKRTINIAFASWHIQLKKRVSDFWHVHLFFCGTRIKSEGANHQHFLQKNDDYSKMEKENKNRRGHPHKMFRFPSPSLSWGWVGRSGKKKGTITWRGLGAMEGRAAKYESLVTLSFCS